MSDIIANKGDDRATHEWWLHPIKALPYKWHSVHKLVESCYLKINEYHVTFLHTVKHCSITSYTYITKIYQSYNASYVTIM